MLPFALNEGIIIAPATPSGQSALAIIRISGKGCIELTSQFFEGSDLKKSRGYSLRFGNVIDENGHLIDEVMISVYKNPKSYTGEDMIEVSCHGSDYIVQEIIRLFTRHGVNIANSGEFSIRALKNGKMDLSQVEAVADLISSKTKMMHDVALRQLKGGFSGEIKDLRNQLINFASLIELELDFSEEDVEFADRCMMLELLKAIQNKLASLINSFKYGNVLKNGVTTVIAGRPNAGKSTLLNALLNEDRAIVSDIPGTTRDTIEGEINIDGILFRLIDTAGIREAHDTIEKLGVERTLKKINSSSLVLYIYDAALVSPVSTDEDFNMLELADESSMIIANKCDKINTQITKIPPNHIAISAKSPDDIERLKKILIEKTKVASIDTSGIIITNERHYNLLIQASDIIAKISTSVLENIPADLVAIDIRSAINTLGEITGEITTEDLLSNIFSKFCIGK